MSQWIMVTLDSGTEALVRDEMRRTGLPMNEAINELLRAGSRSRQAGPLGVAAARRPGFELEPVPGLLERTEETRPAS